MSSNPSKPNDKQEEEEPMSLFMQAGAVRNDGGKRPTRLSPSMLSEIQQANH